LEPVNWIFTPVHFSKSAQDFSSESDSGLRIDEYIVTVLPLRLPYDENDEQPPAPEAPLLAGAEEAPLLVGAEEAPLLVGAEEAAELPPAEDEVPPADVLDVLEQAASRLPATMAEPVRRARRRRGTEDIRVSLPPKRLRWSCRFVIVSLAPPERQGLSATFWSAFR
jgi:hypothetical protein